MSIDITRRGLFAAAAAAGAVACAGTALAQDAPNAVDADILVIGAGFGGLTAAVMAAEAGKKVVVLESSVRVGGTALVSGGGQGGPKGAADMSVEQIMALRPLTDPVLCDAYSKAWDELSAWHLESGVPATVASATRINFSEGNINYAEWMQEHLEELGAAIMLQTRAYKLVQDAQGAVVGAYATQADGSDVYIAARATILACGGYMNNKAALEQFLGVNGDMVGVRGNPHDDGAGMMMALGVGAGLSRSLGNFYGYLVGYPFATPQTAAEWDQKVIDNAWVNQQNAILSNVSGYEGYACIVNNDGLRYVDETIDGYLVAQKTAAQPLARAYVILDSAARQEFVGKAKTGPEKIDLLVENGSTLEEAATLEELAATLSTKYGVPAGVLLKTVADYNAACEDGSIASLPVPKTNAKMAVKVENGPFYCLLAAPAISLCLGGVAADERARVLSGTGKPIAGLYAIPGTSGGLAYRDFAGAISSTTCFGLIAAKEAVAAIDAQ